MLPAYVSGYFLPEIEENCYRNEYAFRQKKLIKPKETHLISHFLGQAYFLTLHPESDMNVKERKSE